MNKQPKPRQMLTGSRPRVCPLCKRNVGTIGGTFEVHFGSGNKLIDRCAASSKTVAAAQDMADAAAMHSKPFGASRRKE